MLLLHKSDTTKLYLTGDDIAVMFPQTGIINALAPNGKVFIYSIR